MRTWWRLAENASIMWAEVLRPLGVACLTCDVTLSSVASGRILKSLLLKDLEKGADRMKKYFSKLFTHHGVPHRIQINTRGCSHRLTWLRQQVTHLRKCTRLPPFGHFLWCTLHKLIPQGSHRPIDNQNHGTASFSSASNNGHVSAYCTILGRYSIRSEPRRGWK